MHNAMIRIPALLTLAKTQEHVLPAALIPKNPAVLAMDAARADAPTHLTQTAPALWHATVLGTAPRNHAILPRAKTQEHAPPSAYTLR